MKGKMGMLSL